MRANMRTRVPQPKRKWRCQIATLFHFDKCEDCVNLNAFFGTYDDYMTSHVHMFKRSYMTFVFLKTLLISKSSARLAAGDVRAPRRVVRHRPGPRSGCGGQTGEPRRQRNHPVTQSETLKNKLYELCESM